MSNDTNKAYRFEMLARKTVVVWASNADEARNVADSHLMDDSNWQGLQSEGDETPISKEIADAELRHGAIEDFA